MCRALPTGTADGAGQTISSTRNRLQKQRRISMATTESYQVNTAGTARRTASGHTTAICASKVIGTEVKNQQGEVIGEINDIVLDKLSNNIMYAVVSFGGFLGIGEKYHPVPWASLDYDESENAYVGGFSRTQLEAAPFGSLSELTSAQGVSYRDKAFDYYKVNRYW
jgi:sporulation protein YlmC with PRC-barrel domain